MAFREASGVREGGQSRGDCVVVASHPRSGTHFTIDFLRRNFAEFAFLPKPWESAETLYYNLDRETGFRAARRGWSPASTRRSSFLVKTHDLPFEAALGERLTELAGERRVTVLYPYRRMSRTLASFHRHRSSRLDLAAFLESEDTYFGTGESVGTVMLRHGEWALGHAVPLDVEDAIARPREYAAELGARFGWTATAVHDPLPPKRLAAGRLGELVERMRGRRSSEVAVRGQSLPHADAAAVDSAGPLADLYLRLGERSLRPRWAALAPAS